MTADATIAQAAIKYRMKNLFGANAPQFGRFIAPLETGSSQSRHSIKATGISPLHDRGRREIEPPLKLITIKKGVSAHARHEISAAAALDGKSR